MTGTDVEIVQIATTYYPPIICSLFTCWASSGQITNLSTGFSSLLFLVMYCKAILHSISDSQAPIC